MSAIIETLPDFDPTVVRGAYAQDRRFRIREFWPVEHAAAISRCLAQETRYLNAYFAAGRNREASDGDFAKLTPADRRLQQQQLFADAAQGVGFLYGRHHISLKHVETDTPETLRHVMEVLNSPEMLGRIRLISGFDDICCATAQATRYAPGNFLTRHNDIKQDEGRRVAYVLGFSPRWHPDWGGLLQFYRQDGTPRDAWTPEFNSLTLFDVHHVHAVTYVAPFAPSPRLLITGWFCNRPPAQ